MVVFSTFFNFFYVIVVSPNHVDVLIQSRKWQSRRDWVISRYIVQIQMVSSVFAIYGWWMRNLLSSSGLFLSHLWDWIFRPTQCTSGRRRPAKYLHDIYFRRTSQQNPLSTLYLLLYPVTLNLFCYLQIFAGFPVFPSNHHNRNSALHGSHNPQLQNIPKVLTNEPIS